MTEIHQEWDIVTGVGRTALAVAAARAVETATEGGLIRDPYAAAFVAAAGADQLSVEPSAVDPQFGSMVSYLGVRTRFFDEYLTAAAVDQAVIVAAGLDTRAYRLDWRDADVYEIDQPRVLEFKQEVLDAAGASPACRRHTVPIDLRGDWAGALAAAGFDPARPTAWLVEGLLVYLPPAAEEALFDTIGALSAPGSRMGIERIPDSFTVDEMAAPFADSAKRTGVALESLWNLDPRRNVIDWLRDSGWKADVEEVLDVYERYGREFPPQVPHHLGRTQYVTARL